MEIRIQVCDVCKDPARSVTQYTITAGGVSERTDRCTEHGEPFALVLASRREVAEVPAVKQVTPAAKKAQPRKRHSPRVGPGGRRVVSVEEIEAEKRRR